MGVTCVSPVLVRRIDNLVTEVDERTTERRRVDDLGQLDRAAGDPFQLLHHLGTLCVSQLTGSRHDGPSPLGQFGGNVKIAVDDLLEGVVGRHHRAASQEKGVLADSIANQRRE